MKLFVAEIYLSRSSDDEPAGVIRRVEAAAQAESTTDLRVRHVRSIFMPDDESCLVLLEAPSAEATVRVMETAGVVPIRITRAWTGEARTRPS